jgi:hypothetical protein
MTKHHPENTAAWFFATCVASAIGGAVLFSVLAIELELDEDKYFSGALGALAGIILAGLILDKGAKAEMDRYFDTKSD